MKTAKSIIGLATEIQRQNDSKKDFIVPTQSAHVDYLRLEHPSRADRRALQDPETLPRLPSLGASIVVDDQHQ